MAQHNRPMLSIAIVSFNTARLLRSCLAGLPAASSTADLEVIVVDNGSTDGSVAMMRETFPEVTLIANERNVGFGAANNQAVAAAHGEYVLLLNSDTLVWPGALDRLLAAIASDPAIGLVGPRLLGADGRPQRSAFRFPSPIVLLLEQLSLASYLPATRRRPRTRDGQEAREVDWLLGACVLGRREQLAALGPFDPQFFMYGEDIDLCWRVRASGSAILQIPAATITHVGGMSTRRDRLRMALQSTESMYLFYRKHYGRLALWLAALIFRSAAAARAIRDLGRWLWLASAGGAPERRRALVENLRLWARVIRLRPPRVDWI